MNAHNAPKNGQSQKWANVGGKKTTFREKWSTFPWRPFLVVISLPLALAPIVALAAAAETASQLYIRGLNCYPNGLWKYQTTATWEIMDSTYFFTPNLSFGAMTFTQVKVIDIAWDLMVGRGGQVLLAWVNYRVFNEWLVYHMEMHLTSYKMYAAVAFQTTTMGTLGVLGKEFLAFGRGTWKRFFRWLAMLCMFLSTLYVLAFPTLMAAMTGYVTAYKPYIEDDGSNFISIDHVHVVKYVVNDADRIGYEKPLLVPDGDDDLVRNLTKYMESLNMKAHTKYPTSLDPNNVLSEAYFSSPDAKSEISINGKDYSLPPPSLNITIYPLAFQLKSSDPADWNNHVFTIAGRQGTPYRGTYLTEHTSCKPSDTYQWGFSYIFLFMVSIFNFVWSCIMVGMWMDTRRGSRMYKSGRRPGLLRSIMDYSASIREELGREADDMGEEELRNGLRRCGGALVVPREELKVRRRDTGAKRESAKRGKWAGMTKGSTF